MSNKEFLESLNKKLHRVEDFAMWPNMRGRELRSSTDLFTDKSMTRDELERLLGIVEKDELMVYPTNTNMGLSVGFVVAEGYAIAPGVPPSIHVRVLFKENQLPQGYDFDRLKPYFLSDKNVDRMHFYGLSKPEADRSVYDY